MALTFRALAARRGQQINNQHFGCSDKSMNRTTTHLADSQPIGRPPAMSGLTHPMLWCHLHPPQPANLAHLLAHGFPRKVRYCGGPTR